MKNAKQPRTKKPAAARRLSHGEVLDFVTGGAATQANRRHAAGTKTAPRATKSATRTASSGLQRAGDGRLAVNIRKDLHRRLKMEATRRRTTVGDVLEQLLQQHLKG